MMEEGLSGSKHMFFGYKSMGGKFKLYLNFLK